MLRRYDRGLLGDLCRVAAGVIVEKFRVLPAAPQVQPGLVVCATAAPEAFTAVDLDLEEMRDLMVSRTRASDAARQLTNEQSATPFIPAFLPASVVTGPVFAAVLNARPVAVLIRLVEATLVEPSG